MRRRVIGVLVLLMLGSITSVLVAWGCVYWGFSTTSPVSWGEHRQSGVSWVFTNHQGFGIKLVQLTQGREHLREVMEQFDDTLEMPLASWVNPVASNEPRIIFSQHVSAGWPFQSMTCQTRVLHQRAVGWAEQDVWQQAFLIPNRRLIWAGTPLPLRPRFWGSLGNGLSYAVAWWILWRGARGIWWAMTTVIRRVWAIISPSSSSSVCPRCGYDQRGVIAGWMESCPLRGTCSECGLDFNWNELLNPHIHMPAWCIERSLAVWRFPLQIIGTCLRTLWPWKVWRQIRMSHELNRPRLFAFVVILIISGYLVFSLCHGWLAYHEWNQQVSQVGGGYTASTTGWPVFAQAALLPWSNEPRGTFTSAGGWWTGTGTTFPYTTPQRHFSIAWRFVLPSVIWAIGVQATCGAAFLALPVSRRKARVRWRHVLRLMIYGGGILAIPFMLLIVSTAAQATRIPGYSVVVLAAQLSGLLFLPYLVVWWSVGTSRYLHMPHGWAVGLSVVVIGVMLPLVPWAIYSMLSSPL